MLPIAEKDLSIILIDDWFENDIYRRAYFNAVLPLMFGLISKKNNDFLIIVSNLMID